MRKSEKVAHGWVTFSLFLHFETVMISWYDLFLLAVKRRMRVRVEGDSMLPTYKNGDEVLVQLTKDFLIGDIVLAKHPYKSNTKIIKRISKIAEDGSFFLIGDNPHESTDSRTFGSVSPKNLIGKVC